MSRVGNPMGRTIAVLLLLALVACAPVPGAINETNNTSIPIEEPEELEVPEQPEEPEEPEEEPDAVFTVVGTEGELIRLNPEAIDPDGDAISYEFTEPFDRSGKWQTMIGDEGRYHVAVTASDSKAETTQTILVIVQRANRPPLIDCNDPVRVNEGERIDLHDQCAISDEDDEEVVVTYGGWMGSWRYTTDYDDAGEHTVTITASDKRKEEILHTVKENVTIIVANVNRPPTFASNFPETVSATENDIITLPEDLITDPDGDAVTVTYSDPFDSKGVWKTRIGDAGTYDVDVVATDGKVTAKRTVTVKVALRNTAPTLKEIPPIAVDEGETVRLPISATDREGDPLSITIAGWMTDETKRTGYDDAGEYTTKVTVTDGTFTTSQVVEITVRDVNRPPFFVQPA